MRAAHPAFGEIDDIAPAAWGAFGADGPIGREPFAYPIADFYRTDPISRASPTMAKCSELFGARAETPAADRHAWLSFWTGYALPTAIIVGEILAIIVPLLLGVAYYTYAERKVLAIRNCAKGRTSSARSGCCSRSPTG